ncbi:MAG: hypothetical protein LH650_00005, partial [Chloroflexi bacterium]|nr:hypothetical protein [Chloroflexota bacterium]
PLPFVAYVAGAAIAVAGAFVVMAASDPGPPKMGSPGRIRTVPRWVRLGLRAIGLVAWFWIVAQALTGGSSDADVASLFLWVYGWVGLALVSAFLGPVWSWLDPFTTIHDILATVGRRLGLRGLEPQPWPQRLGLWIAVGGLTFFIWLELVARVLQGRPLALVLVGYTAVTLLGMLQYGRDAWRAHAETFTVWFGILGRLAPFALVGTPESGQLARRPIASGLISSRWSREVVIMVALGTGAIIYDGLSQTRGFFDLFGFPSIALGTIVLGMFLGAITGLVLLVARRVGLGAIGAGLLPVAMGYLIAHYLSFLLIDGQRILIALSDPFQQAWDLFGTAFMEPSTAWLPTRAMWSIQVGAVVIGHIVGAWAGHAVARTDAAKAGSGSATTAARGMAGGGATTGRGRSDVRAQLPLALLMVGLTTLTLWSLGQNLVFEETPERTLPAATTAP